MYSPAVAARPKVNMNLIVINHGYCEEQAVVFGAYAKNN